MRNPDDWQPPQRPEPPDPPRAALAGLIVIALLIVGGLALAHVIRSSSSFQDCVLSGRKGCDVP